MMGKKGPSHYATVREAERGIYIDFEGGRGVTPDLLGILVENEFWQVALSPALSPAARATGIQVGSLETTVTSILDRCEEQGRRLFAFTRHELRVAEKHTDLGPRIWKLYADGHKIAKRWSSRLQGGKPRGKDLKSFLRHIGRPLPKRLGGKTVLKKLWAVKKAFAGKVAPVSMPEAERDFWKEALEYNEFDCRGLRELTILAARELESCPERASGGD